MQWPANTLLAGLFIFRDAQSFLEGKKQSYAKKGKVRNNPGDV